ncbi:MAG TPA: ABC transporter ATP-binding protein [Candidatus Nanopelagicales bacterium]|nr:ABC transporter ATP-binding protein [Candidatus Nanopelagicales bacterium]
MTAALQLHELVVGYGGEPVVRGVSLDVDHGEFLAVLGASGSGKTTLLRSIAGYLRPTAGTITVDGENVAGPHTWVPPEKRHIGVVPQEGALFPQLDVAGNIGFGLPRRERRTSKRVSELLEMVGLAGLEKARPDELSGGQQQRVALARALAPAPKLLLLDEPFSSLDAALRVEVRTEVHALLREIQTTSILVTHDQEEALSIADQVAVMSVGRIEQVDAPWRVYESPSTLGIARFVGDLVELPVQQVREDSALTSLGWVPVMVEDLSTQEPLSLVALRPEQLALVADRTLGEPDQETQSAVGTVEVIRYHGHDSLTTVRLADGTPVAVRSAGGAGVTVGDRVRVVVTGTARAFADPVV